MIIQYMYTMYNKIKAMPISISFNINNFHLLEFHSLLVILKYITDYFKQLFPHCATENTNSIPCVLVPFIELLSIPCPLPFLLFSDHYSFPFFYEIEFLVFRNQWEDAAFLLILAFFIWHSDLQFIHVDAKNGISFFLCLNNVSFHMNTVFSLSIHPMTIFVDLIF
jgi:hypothetical protein